MKTASLLVAAALSAVPCAADWRDVPDVRGVCTAGCGDPGRAGGRAEREYIPPAPTAKSIAYDHGEEGSRLQKAGDWAGAERAYRAAWELDPNSHNGSVYSYQLGYSLLMQDRWREAEAALRASLALRDYAYAHNNLGFILEKQGRLAEAEEEYLAALGSGPDVAGSESRLVDLVGTRREAVRRRAFSLAIAKDGAEAEAAWRRYLLAEPESSAAYNNLALALEEQGRHLEAEAAFRESVRLDPEDARAKNNLAALRASPAYAPMLALARTAEFWSGLAADADAEPSQWLGMRCFDDGCVRAQDHAQDMPLLRLSPRKALDDAPRTLRADPEVRLLRARREAAQEKHEEAAEALKAVWSAQETPAGSGGALGLLEDVHKTTLAEARAEARTAEAKMAKRYEDLGFVIPKAP